MQKSVLEKIMVDTELEYYLKPEKDFPLGEGRVYRIIDGKYIRAYFNNKKLMCSSGDMVIGRSVTDGAKQKCETCDNMDVCTVSCRLILSNLKYGYIYYVNIPHVAQVALSQYVEKLLLNNLDAPDVLTKITRVKNGKFTTYTFELVSRWFTDEELNTIIPITKAYSLATNEEQEDFNLDIMLKIKGISDEKINIIKLLLGNNYG